MDATLTRKETRQTRQPISEEGASTSPSSQRSLLELQSQLWKARGLAKQKWLERTLTRPANGPRAAARRSLWINRALDAVKRGQAELKYRAALNDAYAEHLSVLEMTLMGALESRADAGNSGPTNKS